MAKYLKAKCPMQVFDIEDGRAVVKNVKNCTVCRECLRQHEDIPKEDQFGAFIELSKIKQHYLFTVESVGIYKLPEIVKEAIQILKNKAAALLNLQF